MTDYRAFDPPSGPQTLPPEAVGELIDQLGKLRGTRLEKVTCKEQGYDDLRYLALRVLCEIADGYVAIRDDRPVNRKKVAEKYEELLTLLQKARCVVNEIGSNTAYTVPRKKANARRPKGVPFFLLTWREYFPPLDELIAYIEPIRDAAAADAADFKPRRPPDEAFEWLVAELAKAYEYFGAQKAATSTGHSVTGYQAPVGGAFVDFVRAFLKAIGDQTLDRVDLGRKIKHHLANLRNE